MKKLIIIAALAVVGVCAQAASVSWKVNTGATYKSMTYMAFKGNDASLITSILDQGAALDNYVQQVTAKAFSSGTLNARGAMSAATTTTGMTAEDSIFVVLFADSTLAAESSYYVINPVSVASGLYEPPATGTTLNLTSVGSSGTIGTAVPEPTSGLMLLLGMAGLALKRKKA